MNIINNKKSNFFPIILGKIQSPYGLHGWLRIISFTEKKDKIFFYKPLLINKCNKFKIIDIEKWQLYNNNFLIKIKNINNRNEATQLSQYELLINPSTLPILETGEYYWKDLIGCQVIDITGHNFGYVINLLSTGIHDILVIQSLLTDNNIMIPFIQGKFILKVLLNIKYIEVNWKKNNICG